MALWYAQNHLMNTRIHKTRTNDKPPDIGRPIKKK
jgi:hypothetical protein